MTRSVVLSALVAALVMLLSPAPVTARDPVRCEIKKLAEKLRDFFTGQRIKEVAVGDVVNADPTTPSTSGPAMRRFLVEELERAELKVKLRAAIGLSVSYRFRKVPQPRDRKNERLVAELNCTVTFIRENTQQDVLNYTIENTEAVLILWGGTVGPEGTRENERAAQVVLAYDKPRAPMDGTVALAGKESPFGLELLVAGKSLPLKDEDGLALASVKREQVYAVRLVNRAPYEVAVRLSIDGLNIFTFSDLKHTDGAYKGTSLYDMVLIPAGKDVVIKGWHKNNTTSHEFKVTHYADTAAAKMHKTTDLGTITATFCAAWEKTPPPGEPDGSRGPGDDGTGFGQPTEMRYKVVQRTIGAVRGSVAVRYRVPKE